MEGQQFFEKYESSHQALINAAELYIKTDSSGMLHMLNNYVFYMYSIYCMSMVLLNCSMVLFSNDFAGLSWFHCAITSFSHHFI